MIRSAISLALLAFVQSADPVADLIKSLPTWGPTPTKQYSGYLDIKNTTKHLHYWFVEAEGDPSSAPLVLWFNGGPGCSSLDGYWYELGPLHIKFDNDTSTTPVIYENDYRWNKMANVLFIEAPAGVGFSYADDKKDYSHTDTSTAEDNLAALQAFFSAYPQYKNNDMYISGESYAGIYVPTLAYQVITKAKDMKLKGILVGNGCLGHGTEDVLSERINVDFLHGHGLYEDSLYAEIISECGDFKGDASAKCQASLGKMGDQIGHVNIYDIYDVCKGELESSKSKSKSKSFMNMRRPETALDHLWWNSNNANDQVKGPDACINAAAAQAFLNSPATKAAIHVPNNVAVGNWSICTGRKGWDYKSDQEDERKVIYPALLAAGIKVLIFNGDADACIPYNGNEAWTKSMGLPLKAEGAWHAWETNEQVSGYATCYEKDFTFVTIKGAGHMVPQYKPAQAYDMLDRFMTGKPF